MRKLLILMSIDCEKSVHYCDKSQYTESSFKEKIGYKFHIFICKVCKEYSTQNTKLTQVIKKANLSNMPKADKELLKSKLDQQIRQQ